MISILKYSISLYKIGRIVVFIYVGDTVSSVNEGDLGVVGTIPEEFIPDTTYSFCNLPVDDNIRIQLTFKIDGEIIAHNYKESISAINACRYNGVYVTKN